MNLIPPSSAITMKQYHRLLSVSILAVSLMLCAAGCGSVESVVTGKQPVRIGVARIEFSSPPVMLPRRAPFFQELSSHIGQPVQPELMLPRQIRVHLGLEANRVQFAMLSPADYAEVSRTDQHRIIALPVNEHGKVYREGLIIVGRKSPIEELSQIRAKRFHFLPKGHALNDAARGTLLESELTAKDISQGFFGLDTHHINSLEVAKSVVLENNAAGVIDKDDYESWPESGGSFMLLRPSKDQVRVLAETMRVYEGPVVAGMYTPEETVAQVEDFLFNKVKNKAIVLSVLGCMGFDRPVEPSEYAAFNEMYRKINPDPIYEEYEATTQPVE